MELTTTRQQSIESILPGGDFKDGTENGEFDEFSHGTMGVKMEKFVKEKKLETGSLLDERCCASPLATNT